MDARCRKRDETKGWNAHEQWLKTDILLSLLESIALLDSLLGSRREFSPFVNQLGKMAYGLTSYIDQSIYESTSLYANT